MPRIHPTAIVDAKAQLAEDVEVGPFCIIEGDVVIGAGTVVRDHAVIRRYTTLGSGNFVDSFCSLGGEPQDLKFSPQTVSYVRIGDNNVFREGVTISRATGEGNVTSIGSNNYWMTQAHAGHNALVEDGTVFGNNVALAGHSVVHSRAILSANSAVHQFTWVGEMVMTQGGGMATAHVPPYVMLANGMNEVVGLNRVGLRRAADMTDKDRAEIKEAFRITYRAGLPRVKALAEMDAHSEWGPAASRFREFIHKVYVAAKPFNRGLATLRLRGLSE
ncbi:MAG: acyl-ACP--UDP-N-acetylglucosamine O-acyltransferase [Phycisphaerae bacterium]|jgi:UDP-N-acetylglucosamine acyltransferase